MAIQLAGQSVTPSSVLSAVKVRLKTGLSLTDLQVRIMVPSEDMEIPHVAEKHIEISISGPQPVVESGAGRYGYKISRIVSLRLFTSNLLDQAGSYEYAAKSHFDFEDTVLNVMLDDRHPSISATNTINAIRAFRYIGNGSSEPQRVNRDDRSLITSSLGFEYVYAAPTSVVTA